MASTAIIGIGAIASAGYGVNTCYESALRGQDGLQRLTNFETGLKAPPLVGQINEDLTQITRCASINRTLDLAICAADECFMGLHDYSSLRLGIVFATTVAGITRSEIFYKKYLKDPAIASIAGTELSHHEPTALSGELARRYNAQGFITTSTACSTGLHAIGLAKRLIENDRFDICLAVGADALSNLTVWGFSGLMLLDPQGCRPFDKNRAGISLGEGAGAILLSSEKACHLLKKEPLARVSGWGAAADCHHMTAPHPQGIGAKNAIQSALSEADITPSAIDFIITHGTATPDNDISEINALRQICTNLPPFCSLKRCFGHTLAASGSLEAVLAVKCLQTGMMLPSPGFKTTDEQIGCNPLQSAKKNDIRHILKNAFGFGGNNAALLLSKW